MSSWLCAPAPHIHFHPPYSDSAPLFHKRIRFSMSQLFIRNSNSGRCKRIKVGSFNDNSISNQPERSGIQLYRDIERSSLSISFSIYGNQSKLFNSNILLLASCCLLLEEKQSPESGSVFRSCQLIDKPYTIHCTASLTSMFSLYRFILPTSLLILNTIVKHASALYTDYLQIR